MSTRYLVDTIMKRILILDDDLLCSIALKNLLENLGYEVFVCEHERTLKRILSERKYDAMFLDHFFGDFRGDEMKESIKALIDYEPKFFSHTAAIYTPKDIIPFIQDYGFDDVLPKPVDFEILKRIMIIHNL